MAHLRKRGKKKWQIVIEKDRDPVTGERKRIYKTINGTKREAEKVMRKMVYEMENGLYVKPSKLKVKDLLLKWLESCKSTLQDRSYASYKMIVEKHFIPALGDIPLKDLKPFHIESYQNQKLTTGRKDKKSGGLSPTTVQNHNHLLTTALDYGVRMQMIKNNPAKVVKAPRRAEVDVKFLDKGEIKKLLNAAPESWIHDFVLFAVQTGMRRGEVIGLEWENVDLKNKKIHVKQILQRVRGQGLKFKSPKTKSSQRTIDLNDELVNLLKDIKKHQAKRRLRLGKKYYTDKNLVFCNEDGSPCNPQGVTRQFKRLAKKAGFFELRLHDLRHSHASLLLKEGVHPKVVQERLGHSSITQTLDTYSHIQPSLQKEAAEKITITS